MDINDDVRKKRRESMEVGFASNYSGRTTIASIVTTVLCNGWGLFSSYTNISILNTCLLLPPFCKARVCAVRLQRTQSKADSQFLADDL